MYQNEKAIAITPTIKKSKRKLILICIACVVLISGIMLVKYVQNRIEVSKIMKQQELEDYRISYGA